MIKIDMTFSSALDVGELYNKLQADLYIYLSKILKNKEDVHDTIQDTFLKLVHCKKQFSTGRDAKKFIYCVARNTAFDRLRNIKSHNLLAEKLIISKKLGAKRAEPSEHNEMLKSAISSIQKSCRKVLKLRYEHGLSFQEISKTLNLSYSSVRVYATRGMDTLRRRLNRPSIVAGHAN